MIYSLVGRRIEDVEPGSFPTGVSRFDSYLRRVFPEMRSITPACLPIFTPDDVVIADNHLSMRVPDNVPTIVVHHGCAASHWHADETWRNANTARIVDEQRRMLTKPNRLYVAPSSWVRDEFARWYGLPADYARVIVNWVPVIERQERLPSVRPIILGDWRDANKGANLISEIALLVPRCDFRQLHCKTDSERILSYCTADLYLCASASEGGSYSMADAEAASLRIVTTPCGNAWDFDCCWVTPRDAKQLAWMIRTITEEWPPRIASSYYLWNVFEMWADLWRQAVEDVRAGHGWRC